MSLTYRGVQYKNNPVVLETSNEGIAGKYRGLDWRFRNLKKPFVLQPSANLVYRGVKYSSVVTVKAEPEVAAIPSTESKARMLMTHHTQAVKKRQQSLLTRVAAEIGLSKEAVQF